MEREITFCFISAVFPVWYNRQTHKTQLDTASRRNREQTIKAEAGRHKDSWTLVQLPVLDLRINLHPSLDKGLMTTGDPVSWAPERTTQESSGPSPPDYSSVIPKENECEESNYTLTSEATLCGIKIRVDIGLMSQHNDSHLKDMRKKNDSSFTKCSPHHYENLSSCAPSEGVFSVPLYNPIIFMKLFLRSGCVMVPDGGVDSCVFHLQIWMCNGSRWRC
ncbi:hypothetical protein STEG23_024258 [Scotinomys teguina]